ALPSFQGRSALNSTRTGSVTTIRGTKLSLVRLTEFITCCLPTGSKRGKSFMSAREGLLEPPIREEFEREILDASNIGEIERPLSLWERITNITLVRRLFILAIIAAAWQLYASLFNNPLMIPTFTDMMVAIVCSMLRD